MKLRMHELAQPVSLSLTQKDGWVDGVFTRLKLKLNGQMSIVLKLSKEKTDIFIEGHISVGVDLSCSRCAKPTLFHIDEFFFPVFVQGKDPVEGKAEVDRGELDVTYFKGNELDLAEMLHEQMVLLIPIQPLCQASCKGLCGTCGQDLNVEDCACKKEVTHSTFNVLKALKVRKKGS